MKGKILVIGGAEDKGNGSDRYDFEHKGVLERFIAETSKQKNSRIEVITAASSSPEESGRDYLKAFRKLGAPNVGILHLVTREDATDQKVLERLVKADAVFVTGGDQLRYTSVIGGTPFYRLLNEKLKTDNKFMYAGTSAGAASASDSMICGGTSENAIRKGEVVTATGLGFVSDIIFDTHFIQRGRIGRLFEIIVSNPTILGVGLEENSALLITGSKMEAVGPGMSIIVDGRNIIGSNYMDIAKGAPLSIENLTLHVMSKTDIFNLSERKLKIITPKEEKVKAGL